MIRWTMTLYAVNLCEHGIEEGDGAFLAFIRQHGSEGEAGDMVDGDLHVSAPPRCASAQVNATLPIRRLASSELTRSASLLQAPEFH